MVKRPEKADVGFDEWIANLHDVFLNAQLMSELMRGEPIEEDAEGFMTSRRGRLERAAMRDLYVLIEALRAFPVHVAELERLVPDELSVVQVLLEDQTRLDDLRNVRDYMSHRDRRRYYDLGRIAPARVTLNWHHDTERAFGDMLLKAMRLVMDKQPSRSADPPTISPPSD